MLEFQNLSIQYRGAEPTLSGVSFALTEGITVLLGRNGVGKSSLLHATLGEVPYTGEILLNGQRISEIRAEGCCYITFKAERQDGMRLLSALSDLLRRDPPDPLSLVSEGEAPCFEKYDEYIPSHLLRRAYACDRINLDEVFMRFKN